MSSSKGVAIVTGAAQGIGKGIALRLAEDGFDVAVNDIVSNKTSLDTLLEEIKQKGRKSCAIIADVSIEEQVKDMVDSVVKELGSLDVMVANAGICRSFDSVLETPVKDWDLHFAINVRGVFLCYKYAGLQMVAQGRGGRIIGASSAGGKQGAPLLGAYCATKFAVRGLTQSLASELGKNGITVNSYAPGAIESSLLEESAIKLSAKSGQGKDFFYDSVKSVPVGYIGTPAEVASLVSYIASKESHFITGQSIGVNGGLNFD